MSLYLYTIFAAVSFSASVVGTIYGVGGGVLIEPMLNAFGVPDMASISFLPGCTVLSMSRYSVGKAKLSGESLVDLKTEAPLAIGVAIGGVAGRMMFRVLSSVSPDKDKVGAIQAVCLLLITLSTMLYTLKKDKIHTCRMTNSLAYTLIDLVLGICSFFLGIGGGSINLVVLLSLFSMDTKTTAQNSLYITLFSQITSLINTLVTGTIPQFSFTLLILMMACDISGGVAGQAMSKRIDAETVNKLFTGLMVTIMLICVYNIYQFI